MFKQVIKLIRVEQWVKNFFVFMPLFFAGKIFDPRLLLLSIAAFFIFSLTASCIYIINDYMDIAADQKHPKKRHRPLASGAISKAQAQRILAAILLVVVGLCLLISSYAGRDLLKFQGIIFFYFVLNLAYCFKLKHVAIVDICIIALGFVLRIFAGGYMTGILISKWAILLTFMLALVLAMGKRRGELVNAERTGNTRKALDGYNIQFADIALCISCTLAIVCYIMFTFSAEVQAKFNPRVTYTVGFVMFAFLRYLQQTLVYNKTESPTKIIYRDRYIQATLLLWFVSFALQIYKINLL
jgi:decaprenyl-phosphate phosphoribosyltransferase